MLQVSLLRLTCEKVWYMSADLRASLVFLTLINKYNVKNYIKLFWSLGGFVDSILFLAKENKSEIGISFSFVKGKLLQSYANGLTT